MLNQVLGSPIGGGIWRILLRVGGVAPRVVEVRSGRARKWSSGRARIALSGECELAGLRHSVTLWLHPTQAEWFWRLEVSNGNEPTNSLCDRS